MIISSEQGTAVPLRPPALNRNQGRGVVGVPTKSAHKREAFKNRRFLPTKIEKYVDVL